MPKSDPNSPLTHFSSCRPPPGKRLRYAFPIDPGPSSSHQKTSEANKAKNIDNNNQQEVDYEETREGRENSMAHTSSRMSCT